jgi:hypothetical protein
VCVNLTHYYFLKTPLPSLLRRGWPVHRLLQQAEQHRRQQIAALITPVPADEVAHVTGVNAADDNTSGADADGHGSNRSRQVGSEQVEQEEVSGITRVVELPDTCPDFRSSSVAEQQQLRNIIRASRSENADTLRQNADTVTRCAIQYDPVIRTQLGYRH